jgi:hypothetical protein
MARLLLLLVATVSAFAQDWVPTRIVAITRYVPLASQAQISGIVEVKCRLAEDGTVADAVAVSGHKLLKEQARQNALLWRFRRSSADVRNATVSIFYEYRLDGPAQDDYHTVFLVDLPNRVSIISPPVHFTP